MNQPRHTLGQERMPLAGPYVGALAQIMGDWKFLKEAHVLPWHYGTRRCCHECEAVKQGDGPYFGDFRADVAHRNTMTANESYLAVFSVPPALTAIPGWHLTMLTADPMHVLHLGVLQWAVASLMLVLCSRDFWGTFAGNVVVRLNSQLRVAYVAFRDWCRARNVSQSQPPFSAVIFNRRDDQWVFPELKTKAANTRWIALWLDSVMQNTGDVTAEVSMMRGFAVMLELMHGCEKPYLSQLEADEFGRAGRVALLSYSHLAGQAYSNGLPLYQVKPKHHQLDHLITKVESTLMNPRFNWAFGDEDFNGRITALVRGKYSSKFVSRAMQKYQLRMYLSVKDAVRRCGESLRG